MILGYDSLLKRFNTLCESIDGEDWYGEGPKGVFADRNARVLGFTHEDLDGVVAGAILKNFYNNIDLQFINYGTKAEAKYEYAKQNADKYDCIVFTDFTPGIDSPNGPCGEGSLFYKFKELGLPMLIIDHHEKVAPANNPSENVYVITGKCGAFRTLEYFSKVAPELHKFDELCDYTNTHDLFLGKKMPADHSLHAKRLNNLCFNNAGVFPNVDFSKSVDRFMEGNAEFNDDELQFLIDKENQDEMDYQNQEKVSLPGNGVLVTNCKNFSSVNEKLEKDGYTYAIHKICNPEQNKYVLSFRMYPDNFPECFIERCDGDRKVMSNESNINNIMARVANGEGGIPIDSNGGGGHACAGGRPCKSEDDCDAYIAQYKNVAGKIFGEESDEKPVIEQVNPDEITPFGF